MTKKTQKPWKNAIVGNAEIDPKTLMPHPENWRLHGDTQTRTMDDVLAEVGWIQQVVVNKRSGRIVDGHLRVKLAIEREEPLVPVVYVDLSDEDEKKALLTLDPISGLADSDIEQFTSLVAGMETDSLWIRELMDTTGKKMLEQGDEESEENKNGEGESESESNLPEMELQPFEGYDYIMLLFKSTQDFASACDKLEIQKVKVTHEGGLTKIGLGRVIDGARAIKMLSEESKEKK